MKLLLLLLLLLAGCGLSRAPIAQWSPDAETVQPDAGSPELDAGSGSGSVSLQLMAHEVTAGDFAAYVAAGGTYTPYDESRFSFDPELGAAELCNYGASGRDLHPMNCVLRSEAAAYCAWAFDGEGRLPTAAEWTAFVGPDRFPWGSSPPTCARAQFAGCPGEDGTRTRPVGRTEPVRGFFDLVGNVFEWMADGTIRGGSWASSPAQCELNYSSSNHTGADQQHPGIGFRCILEES